MEKRFVRSFFDTGELRLPTFNTFRRHSQEAYRDEAEGVSIFTLEGEQSTVAGVCDFSQNAYVLCGSQIAPGTGSSRFGHNGCLHIFDVEGFSKSVAQALSSCQRWIAGDCQYVDDAVLFHFKGGPEIDRHAISIRTNYPEGLSSKTAAEVNSLLGRNDVCAPSPEAVSDEVRSLFSAIASSFDDIFFRKRTVYAKDSERRIVWLCSEYPLHDQVISVPNPTQFCRDASDEMLEPR